MLYGYRYKNSKPRTYCRCKGIDNNMYIVRADALRTGSTKHISGVGKKNIRKDVTNQKFGHLKALFPTEKKSKNGCVVWHCFCECGNYIDVPYYNLIRGHTRSCGCNNRSKWEEFIHDYLSNKNIYFETEKRFDKCRNKKGSDMLPFDFYIPSLNLLIEYDGEHHFIPVKGWGGSKKLKKTKANDEIKNKFCKENGITLLRIPYTYSEEDITNAIDDFMSPVTITA